MTNSFITYKRRREEALEKGLHKMLDYDGVIMTDSGGYQVLQYGQVDMTPSVIAEFQAAVGSDLAVTLDRPTGYSLSEEYARETMKVSLDGARETIKKFGNSATTWVGPIQGGLFDPLVEGIDEGAPQGGFRGAGPGEPRGDDGQLPLRRPGKDDSRGAQGHATTPSPSTYSEPGTRSPSRSPWPSAAIPSTRRAMSCSRGGGGT